MPSVIDPSLQLGGAWTATRTLVKLLRASPVCAEVVSVSPRELSPMAHRARRYTALAKSVWTGLPAKFQFQYSREMLTKVQHLLREEEFDAILLNGSDLLWMLRHLPPGPAKILVAHNIEHALYADQIDFQCPLTILKKGWLMRDCARLREHEMAGMRAAGNVLFLSTEDEEFARREVPELRTMSMPTLMAANAPVPRPVDLTGERGVEIGMLANFEWWPARQGLGWFLREIFPRLHSRIRLHLFGKGSEGMGPDHARIVKHGYVPDLNEVWSTCHFMICPELAGGGVSVKMTEAICRGIPVLATRFATRGLPLSPDPAIMVRNGSEEWVKFLNSDGARELGRRSPSSRIIARFRPEAHVERLAQFMEAAVAESAGARVAEECVD